MSRILLLMGVVGVSACQKGAAEISRTVIFDTGLMVDELDADVTSPQDSDGESPVDTSTSPQDTGPEDTTSDDTGHADTGHTDSGHVDTGHTDSGHVDTGHTDSGHVDTGHTDSGHVDTGHTDSGHAVLITEDTATEGADHTDTGPMDSGHSGLPSEDTAHGEPTLEDSGDPETVSGDTGHGGVGHPGGPEDTGAEDTGAEDTGAEDTGAEDTGAEDTGDTDTASSVDSGVWADADGSASDLDADGASDLDSDGSASDLDADGASDLDSDGSMDADGASDLDSDGSMDADGASVVHAGPETGDLFVTEIMANPDVVSDLDGEWFELYNPRSTPFSLLGCRFTSDDGDEFSVETELNIPPWGRVVFGVNADETENGGAVVDYEYNRLGFDLDNGGDRIRLENAEGVLVSSVEYTDEWEKETGHSMQLDSSAHYTSASSVGTNWCVANTLMSGGDYGTPHTVNEGCGTVDHDGDGYLLGTGDCDDDDATVSPGQPERWDGIDNNCDGLVDNFSESSAPVHVEGRDSDFLGWYASLSTGDITGDGRADLLAGGSWVGTGGDGGIWMLDGQHASDWSGHIAEWSTAVLEGSDDSSYFGTMSPRMGDQDSDGIDDVLIMGTDGYYPSALDGVYAGSLFYGGEDLVGSWIESEADVIFEASVATYWYVTALADVDFDSDGHDDVFFGNYFASALSRGDVFFFSGDELGSGAIYDVVDDSDWHVQGNSAGDFLGYSLAAGDIDDDGHMDLVSGAAAESYDGVERAGCVYLMPGGPIDTSSGATVSVSAPTDFKVCGDEPHARLGRHAAAQLFDVDGDSTQDLVLSAPGADSGSSEGDGKAFIFFNDGELSGTTTVADADVTLSGGESDYFGYALHHGDFDGDGEKELAVGAPDSDSYDDTLEGAGEVFLYRSSTLAMGGSMTSSSADLRITGTGFSGFGSAINSADFDENGIEELMVAAHRWNLEMGRISVFSLN